MVRNLLGSLLALIGAAVAVWSPFREWNDDRLGRHYRVQDLFTGQGITGVQSDLWVSLLIPMLLVALVTLIGVAARLRPVVAVAGLLAIGFTVLWMVRLGMAAGRLTVGDGGGLGEGVGDALGGGVLLLLGALVMRGRRPAGSRGAHARDATIDDSYAGYGGGYGDGTAPPAEDYGPRPQGPYGAHVYGQDAGDPERYGYGYGYGEQDEPYGREPHGREPYAEEPYRGPQDTPPMGSPQPPPPGRDATRPLPRRNPGRDPGDPFA